MVARLSTFGADVKAVVPGLAITLAWSGGLVVVSGTYLFTGTAPYPFVITGLDAVVGTAGGTLTATVRNAGATCGGLSAIAITSAGKTNFPASGANLAVAAGATVDVVVTATGSPTNAWVVLTGVRA
jgi:hypothetical protein